MLPQKRPNYKGPRKTAKFTKFDLSETENFLVAASLNRVKWFGLTDEAGDYQTSATAKAKNLIKAELISYITKSKPHDSPLRWFREKSSRFAWKDIIKDPVEILLELHNSLEAQQKLDIILSNETIGVVFEAALHRKMTSGDTCAQVPKERLSFEALKLLNTIIKNDTITTSMLQIKIAELADAGYDELWKYRDKTGVVTVSTKERGYMDKNLFTFLTARDEFFKIPQDWSAFPSFTPEQRLVYNSTLQCLRSNGWAVISGPGGSGKTHMLKSLQAAAKEIEEKAICIYYLGPTNRAVSILKQGIEIDNVNSISGTIHSVASRTDLPEGDIAIVDEFSMCASEHGDLLLSCKAISKACFLFVGDHLQLPPVGAGELLRPLMCLKPTTALTENHRVTNETLKTLVSKIRTGSPQYALKFEKHYPSLEQYLEGIFVEECTLVLSLRNEERIKYNSYAIKKHPTGNSRLDYLDDYRKLPSTWSISDKPPRSFVPFVGMKVRLQTNDHKPDFCRGMLGEITRVECRERVWYVHVAFNEAPGQTLILEEALFTLPDILRPAFATTLHDAQGSASDKVGIMLPPSSQCPLLNLEGLYTAASRARKHLIFFSYGTSLSNMIENLAQSTPPRKTPLSYYINDKDS